MPNPPTFGPYQTERDTYDSPLHRAWMTQPVDPGDVAAQRARSHALMLRHLLETCKAAGVELGAYDERILTWLAGYEASTMQVFIGLISRAYAAGRRAGDEIESWLNDLAEELGDDSSGDWGEERDPVGVGWERACKHYAAKIRTKLGEGPSNATVLPEELRKQGGGDL